jgi:ABC-type glutathione transport system ATPase component
MTPRSNADESGTKNPLLAVRELTISFDVDGAQHAAVKGVSFDVGHGEVVALVGESGSGKSVTAMSLLGLLPGNASVSGSARLGDDELFSLDRAQLRAVRGGRIGMIFQDPQAALNPVFSIGFQLAEAVRQRDKTLSRTAVRDRVIELLTLVEVPDPAARLSYYPHQLSGGQCQRVVIAMALAGEPQLLIADEPTTALDVTVQAEVLDVLRRMRERLASSILIITHDMGVVADLADRVVVMKEGGIVESNEVHELFSAPRHDYTRQLLSAVPRLGERDAATGGREGAPDRVLEVSDLVVEYHTRLRGSFRAVDGVNLSIGRGEILALVGESGSGKTTIGLSAIGLAPRTSGSVTVAGVALGSSSRAELKAMRQRVGVVFQNPATSLNPRFAVHQSVAEPLRVHRGLRGAELTDRVDSLLEAVGLGGGWRDRYPHELSGGQRQRVAIARAVALDPDLLIADEPTSALDVSVQARVLDIFRELQQRLGFACLFISHDLAVVDTLSDRVAVMHRGKVVEFGDRDRVLRDPQHPYTKALIAAAPVPDPGAQRAKRDARRAS